MYPKAVCCVSLHIFSQWQVDSTFIFFTCVLQRGKEKRWSKFTFGLLNFNAEKWNEKNRSSNFTYPTGAVYCLIYVTCFMRVVGQYEVDGFIFDSSEHSAHHHMTSIEGEKRVKEAITYTLITRSAKKYFFFFLEFSGNSNLRSQYEISCFNINLSSRISYKNIITEIETLNSWQFING